MNNTDTLKILNEYTEQLEKMTDEEFQEIKKNRGIANKSYGVDEVQLSKSTKEVTINYLENILKDKLNAKEVHQDKYSKSYFNLNDECLLLMQAIAIVKESEGE